MKTSKKIAAVTLALLTAAQMAGCSSNDDDNSTPNNPPTNPSGGGTGGGDVGGGGTGGGGTGGGGTGGDTGGDGGTGGNPAGELTSGVFVDAAVAGLSYTTSSDLSGVTDAEGRYDYRVGDTVTFSIGDLVLGTVPAQGVVTPVTVAQALAANTATTAETVAVNILTLLQSLDANGNPDDGITFTAEIRDAVNANAIDLTAAEGAFTAALSTFVTSVSSTSGVTLTPVAREDALAHFVGQAPVALAGTYVRADENFAPITQKIVTLTMFRNGRYLLGGQHDDAACNNSDSRTPDNPLVFSDANGNGVEYASYTWDPLTNAFAVGTVTRETDGFCGFNEPVVDAENDIETLVATANGLEFRDSDGTVAYRFVRLQPQSSGLAGVWLQPTSLMQQRPFTLALFPSAEESSSGRYVMVDASLPNNATDESPGIEEGCYSIDAQNNLSVELNSTVCAGAIDTNDTAGASDSNGLKLFIDENDRLVIAEGEEQTGFTRLPTRAPTYENLAGSWILQANSEVALSAQEQLFMLTVFDDGRFLFGSEEKDATCIDGYPTPNQEEDGNGLEYGTLSLTAIPGLVKPVNITADTNGECGLFHQGKTPEQAYFVVPNAAGDALVLWANDAAEDDPEGAAGIVFKRVPSVADTEIGAWLWDGGADGEVAVIAFFEGDVLFEVAHRAEEAGILREQYSIDGDTLTAINDGYAYCTDTAYQSCNDGEEEVPAPFTVEGDTFTYEDATATRIK